MRGSTTKGVANLQPRKSKCCDCILIVSSNFFYFSNLFGFYSDLNVLEIDCH